MEGAKMEINESKVGTTLILSLTGRLDATTSPGLEKFVMARVQAGSNRLLFDFSKLQYISSAGLRVLALVLKQVSSSAGHMALCGMREPVKMVFDVSGFTSFFPISASIEEALAASPPLMESQTKQD